MKKKKKLENYEIITQHCCLRDNNSISLQVPFHVPILFKKNTKPYAYMAPYILGTFKGRTHIALADPWRSDNWRIKKVLFRILE